MADVKIIKYNTLYTNLHIYGKQNIILIHFKVCLKLAFDPAEQIVFGDKSVFGYIKKSF